MLFLTACSVVQARELTWEQALSEARQNNPSIKRSAETLNQARLAYSNAYANFMPNVSASAGASQSKSDTSDLQRSYSLGLNGSLSLFAGFADYAEIKTKQADLKIAEANYRRSLADMVYELKYSFVNLLWAQEMQAVAEKILGQRTQNFGLVQLKYDSGTEDKGSLLRVEADKDQAAYDYERAKRAVKTAAIRFLKAMGSDEIDGVTVKGDLSASGAPTDAPLYQLVENTPEYLSSKLSMEKSDYLLVSARSWLYPDLSLSGGINRTGQEWMPDKNSWNLGLSLSYNLFNGGRDVNSLRSSASQKASAMQALRETRQQLAFAVNSALNSFIDAVNYVSVSDKYLKASAEQSKVTTAKYINGLASYSDWYNVENDYINSMRSLLNAKRDALLQEANFNKTLGRE